MVYFNQDHVQAVGGLNPSPPPAEMFVQLVKT